ncbi:MAG: di-heme enzyme [Acidobacteria bacterium]|nr:di-heme enzyme [Acidobacteriota bacterium]
MPRLPQLCRIAACAMLGVALVAGTAQEPFVWDLPPGFPEPWVPADNPMTAAKVELGRRLFYDPRLSANRTQSCGSCHRQELAFTDGRARGLGSTGEEHPRGSMSLANVAYAPTLTWAHPTLDSLELQARVPLFGVDPVELGQAGREEALLEILRRSEPYPELLGVAFPSDAGPFSVERILDALACFERTILSGRSPYDRYHFGSDASAISPAAQRGEILFFSGEKAGCFQCHGGFNFSGPVRTAAQPDPPRLFHNTGLYNLPGTLSYPPPNTGIHAHTGRPEDVGKFRTPTLRNIAVTAPYMHDGSVATLEQAIEHYAAGGRHGDNPLKSRAIRRRELSPDEKRDLLEFLRSLTDQTLLTDPRWSDPWTARPKK